MAIPVKIACWDCGIVTVPLDDLHLFVRLPNRADCSQVGFRCPVCDANVLQRVTVDQQDLLVESGCDYTAEGIPAEALERHDGAPLTPDDMIDIGLDLAMLERLPLLGTVDVIEARQTERELATLLDDGEVAA